jgi:hypothetical protein
LKSEAAVVAGFLDYRSMVNGGIQTLQARTQHLPRKELSGWRSDGGWRRVLSRVEECDEPVAAFRRYFGIASGLKTR